MADPTDIQKRLGKKYRHITWVNHLKAGTMNPADRDDYYTKVAEDKEREEEQRLKAAKKKPGPGI